jgi:zinc transporter ZupT
MRLQNGPLSFVVSFLLGVAWAAVLLGAITSFLAFYPESLLLAFISAFIGALPGMISVLLLEHIITAKERYVELKKQTALLEKILEQKEKNDLQ